ncbi:MAG: crossover junction endodeoxyribonuclease RuvC [Verrucomicrobia bacterium]|nr:crossover junction endodeoxyribonuclease RuvC [Verrucomicrobiota bacterium]
MGFTPQQFEQMQQRLKKTTGAQKATRSATPAIDSSARHTITHQIILGVDPSLRGTGYGIIRLGKPFPQTLVYGTIKCPSTWEHSRCLVAISKTLRELIAKHQPTVCAIEGLFFAQNLQTAIIMGEARGAAMTVIAEAGLDIFEIAPRKMKQAIVGYGGAQKHAVGKMVQRTLQLAEPPETDAADALALALAHAQTSNGFAITASKKI